MIPILIKGGNFKDHRGSLRFNNVFDASKVKRIYAIDMSKDYPERGWQGHKIESRWFTAIEGSFKIHVILIDNWEAPDKNSTKRTFELNKKTLDVLMVPPGYITKLELITEKGTLLAMSDYKLNEVNDDFKYESTYFAE